MNLLKLGFNPAKPGTIQIAYQVSRSTAGPEKYSYEGHEPPHPDLITALAKLGRFVPGLVGWPEGASMGDLTVIGVTIRPHEQGVVIKAIKKLTNNQRPLNLATPYVRQMEPGEGGVDKKGAAPAGLWEAVLGLEAEALAYATKGNRAQGDLFAAGGVDGNN